MLKNTGRKNDRQNPPPALERVLHAAGDVDFIMESAVSDSIREISRVNLSRCLRWHPRGLNSWSPSDWYTALAGEAGECFAEVLKMGDTIKKLNRERDDLPGNKLSHDELVGKLANEIADVYLYLDLLAQAAGVDLATAVVIKFNEVSVRNGFPERL